MAVEITWVGHSTVEVRPDEGDRFVIDPWYTGSPVTKAAPPADVQFAFITHDHWDHVQDVPQVAANGARIVTQTETGVRLTRDEGVPKEAFLHLNLGGSATLAEGLVATMIPAFHTSRSGSPAGYIIQVGGLTIAHLGDTALFSDLKIYGEMFQIDLAMVPIGDHFTMGPRAAAKAVRFLSARMAMPLHYGTFPALVKSAETFIAAVREEAAEVEVWVPQVGGRRSF